MERARPRHNHGACTRRASSFRRLRRSPRSVSPMAASRASRRCASTSRAGSRACPICASISSRSMSACAPLRSPTAGPTAPRWRVARVRRGQPDRARAGAVRGSVLVASPAMAHHIVTLPGDGIGPEIMAPTLELLDHAGRLRVRGAPVRRRLDRRARRRADRRGARRLPARGRRAAGRGRRAEVGHDRSDASRAPSRACSACARGSGCTPTCARSSRCRRCMTPRRCDASGSRAPTCSSCASSPAASTSARRRAPTTSASDLCAYSTRGDRAHRAHRVRAAERRSAKPKVTSVDKANVLETSRLWREVVSELHASEFAARRARARARRQRRDAARLRTHATST